MRDIKETEINGKKATIPKLDAAMAFDAFFHPHLHLGGEQIRQLFFDAFEIA